MEQFDLFQAPEEPGQTKRINNGEYRFWPAKFDFTQSKRFFEALNKGIEWKQESMQMYGKELKFPRLTAWYGDQDKPYSFSGITLQPHPWTKELLEIKSIIEPLAGVEFNSVLLNLYRDGNDSISWHTDAEKELGLNPVIASVNFGAERIFQLRHIESKERIDIPLRSGSLLIMEGALQHYWQHQIPKTKKITSPRINLTFRLIR